jgi:hypothetical protein
LAVLLRLDSELREALAERGEIVLVLASDSHGPELAIGGLDDPELVGHVLGSPAASPAEEAHLFVTGVQLLRSRHPDLHSHETMKRHDSLLVTACGPAGAV